MSAHGHVPTKPSFKKCGAANGLRVGHANVYHVNNKIHDVCMLLTKPQTIHVLGLTETRLQSHITDEALTIPSYSLLRKDAASIGQTGMGIFIHDSILASVKRRHDLEFDNVENMWIEYRCSVTGPATLIGFVYRNPASTLSWYDDFIHMMDNVQKCNADIIMLGDFNIDLLRHIPDSWESVMSLFGLHQLVSQPSRITPTSST